jgi:hypothetical protein
VRWRNVEEAVHGHRAWSVARWRRSLPSRFRRRFTLETGPSHVLTSRAIGLRRRLEPVTSAGARSPFARVCHRLDATTGRGNDPTAAGWSGVAPPTPRPAFDREPCSRSSWGSDDHRSGTRAGRADWRRSYSDPARYSSIRAVTGAPSQQHAPLIASLATAAPAPPGTHPRRIRSLENESADAGHRSIHGVSAVARSIGLSTTKPFS